MKKIITAFCILITLISCQNTAVEKPEKLIDEDEMVNILYDLSLLEAIKSQNVSDSDYTINSSKYIYKKYKVDSVQFAQNNKFYASDIDGYKKMFEKVKKRLEDDGAKVDAVMKKPGGPTVPSNSTSTLNSDTPQVQ